MMKYTLMSTALIAILAFGINGCGNNSSTKDDQNSTGSAGGNNGGSSDIDNGKETETTLKFDNLGNRFAEEFK